MEPPDGGVNGPPPQVTSVPTPPGRARRRQHPRLAKALKGLKNVISKEQREEFKKCSIEDVSQAIKSIEETLGAQRRLNNLARLSKFVSVIGDLAIAAGDSFSTNGENGFLWAPIRLAIQQASRSGLGFNKRNYLDSLVDILVQIGDVFPHLTEYNELFCQHPGVLLLVDEYTATILSFHTGLMEVFNKTGWRAMIDSSWGRFSKMADETRGALVHYRELLTEEKATASMRDLQKLNSSVADQFAVLSARLDKASAQRELTAMETRKEHARESLEHQRREVFEKLDPVQFQNDQSELQRQIFDPTGGSWLLKDERFASWMDLNDESHKVLSLDGLPGAGKSFLVSSVIRHLQELKAMGTNPPLSLAYFYFKHDSEDRKTFTHALRALIAQLIPQEEDEVLIDHAFKTLSRVYKPPKEDLMSLAFTAIRAKRLSFVALDGLDECTSDSLDPLDNQEAVIDWLRDLITKPGESPFTIRVLISGRREGFEETISSFPNVTRICVESSPAHRLSIRQYVDHFTKASPGPIKRVSDDERLSITDKVASRAEGMFLFARLVLACLRDCHNVQDMRNELKDEVFPNGLNEAYERVALKVFSQEEPLNRTRPRKRRSNAEVARDILSLVACAARPLYWREIQARFALDPTEGPAPDLPDKFLQCQPKDICGCLIDSTGSSEISEKLVHIVHRTATEYLQETGRILPAIQQHSEMLSFCCNYLSSGAFTTPLSIEARRENAKTGYYALSDYAAAHWWDHVKALRSICKSHQAHDVLFSTLDALSRLLTAYARDSEDNPVLSDLEPVMDLLDTVVELGDTPSTRNQLFLFEHRILLIREGVDSVPRNHGGNRDLPCSMTRIYGPLRFKCSKPWCNRFHQGFEKKQDLVLHNNMHTRPFRCPQRDCMAGRLGFDSESALNDHQRNYHPEGPLVFFPCVGRSGTARIDPFLQAIREGHLERVRQLASPATINKAIPITTPLPRSSTTPLAEAALHGHFEVCKHLLEIGAKINPKEGGVATGITPLMEAIASRRLDILSLLLTQGNVDIVERRETVGASTWAMDRHRKWIHQDCEFTTLSFALAFASADFVLALLEKVQLPPQDYGSCFQAVCASRAPNRVEVLRLLEKRLLKFDLDWHSRNGRSLLSYAAEANNVEIIDLILASSSPDINRVCSRGRTAALYAARAGSFASLRVISAVNGVNLQIRCKKGLTLLHYAVSSRNLKCVELVLGTGAERITAYCKKGTSPLSLAAAKGYLDCFKSLLGTDIANVDSTADLEGNTAFILAAGNLHLDMVQWLLNTSKVDTARANAIGNTALNAMASMGHWKSWSANKVEEMLHLVRLIVQAAPSLASAANNGGWTPFHHFAECSNDFRDGFPWQSAACILVRSNCVDVNHATTGSSRGYPSGSTGLTIALRTRLDMRVKVNDQNDLIKAILDTKQFSFALDANVAKDIVDHCTRAAATAQGVDQTCGYLIEMFSQGFRPNPRHVLEGDRYAGGSHPEDNSFGGSKWRATLTAHLLAAMSENVDLDDALRPECIDTLEQLAAQAMAQPPVDIEWERFERSHPVLIGTYRRAIEQDFGMDFANPLTSTDVLNDVGVDFAGPLITTDVLDDFDFDAFFDEENTFDFSSTTFGMEGANEIGAE